jgi:hypothetical protein
MQGIELDREVDLALGPRRARRLRRNLAVDAYVLTEPFGERGG